MLQELCANTIANMPDTATPINMVVAALGAMTATIPQEHCELLQQR